MDPHANKEPLFLGALVDSNKNIYFATVYFKYLYFIRYIYFRKRLLHYIPKTNIVLFYLTIFPKISWVNGYFKGEKLEWRCKLVAFNS